MASPGRTRIQARGRKFDSFDRNHVRLKEIGVRIQDEKLEELGSGLIGWMQGLEDEKMICRISITEGCFVWETEDWKIAEVEGERKIFFSEFQHFRWWNLVKAKNVVITLSFQWRIQSLKRKAAQSKWNVFGNEIRHCKREGWDCPEYGQVERRPLAWKNRVKPLSWQVL